MLAVLTTLLIAQTPQNHIPPEWSQRNEVPSYRVAFTPRILQGLKPYAVSLEPGVVRGYRPISSYWLIKKPFAKVAKEAFADLTPEYMGNLTAEQLARRGVAIFSKRLGDRSLRIAIMAGRPVVKKTDRMTGYDHADMDSYTRIHIYERPLPYGATPRTWAKEAQEIPSLPKGVPALPFKEIKDKPTEWTPDGNADGSTSYRLVWYVPKDATVLMPHLTDELNKSKAWQISPYGTRGVLRAQRVTPKEAEFGRLEVGVDSKGWTKIEAIWTDVSTRLDLKRPVRRG